MLKRVLLLLMFTSIIQVTPVLGQTKIVFTGDPAKLRSELTLFMGPNLNDGQKASLNRFLTLSDSSFFNQKNMTSITDVLSQMAGRSLRPVPHFNNFISALNEFAAIKTDQAIIGDWLTGTSEMIFNPRINSDNIDRYIRNTGQMIRNNTLYQSTSVTWKVKESKLKFVHDTVFKVIITDATLSCRSSRDSTEIYDVDGIYYPELQVFHGTSGIITFEKAGYAKEDVFARAANYSLNLTKSSFVIDSAELSHKIYFKTPVLGKLSDQIISVSNKERADFPRFVTYDTQFDLKEIYKGVDYLGGLSFEGAAVKGTGSDAMPARLLMSKNDTLYLKLFSAEFLFSKTGLASGETVMTLFLENDSIYHSNLGFSFNAESSQVSLFRGNNPVSRSPYFNSFHNLDMYFELLSWNMNESKIVMSRARGAALGQAQFESASFFDERYFLSLAGIDDYHPLIRLKRFAEFYYSNTFPVTEFAKWLNKPAEAVTGLCIDLANKGFLFYDRKFNEVTLKKKVDDFLDSFAKKKDYDVLTVMSETKAPDDNAILDLKTLKITVNGVPGVFLSDSQQVAIYPYNRQLKIGKNRNIEFDGVVAAGLFTIYGHNFTFSYDTFKIRLQKIDSIKIAVETEQLDQAGNPLVKMVDNLIQLGTAEVYIDHPQNKSGLRSLDQYPIIDAVSYSYIFYDKIPKMEGIYPQGDFYFKIEPFSYENLDHYTMNDINLKGEFVAGNILKPSQQFLTIREDYSLGFNFVIPEEGVDLYNNKGRLFDNISMSNNGLVGSGKLSRLTSVTESDEYLFTPDSMITQAKTFIMQPDNSGRFPALQADDVKVKWLTNSDEWLAWNKQDKTFKMFNNGTQLDGMLNLSPSIMKGEGIVNTADSRVTSDLFKFSALSLQADTSDYYLKSQTAGAYSFIAENANSKVDFGSKHSTFKLNTDNSVVKFPEIEYICTMTDFDYNMVTRVLKMEQRGMSNRELLDPVALLKLPFTSLDKPTFFSVNTIGDTVSFASGRGSYDLNKEIIEANDINYIHIADALIQPNKGSIKISRRARISQMDSSLVAVNNKFLLHSAKINIESTKRYTGAAVYDYTDENNEIQQITFPELLVDSLITHARGYIPVNQKFMLSPAFTFSGDVNLHAQKDNLNFTGAAGIVQDCSGLNTYSIKFSTAIDPLNIFIPVGEKPRDVNDNPVFFGSYINVDSVHIYPAFLSPQKSWADAGLVTPKGYIWYDKSKSRYLLSSREKIADPSLNDDLLALDRLNCVLTGEGSLNFGADFELVKMVSSGNVVHSMDSGNVEIQAILALNFHFSDDALKIMSDEIRMIPTLKAVNLNSDHYVKGMKNILGNEVATRLKEEIDLFGTAREMPREYNFRILLSDVNLYWNEASSSFRSKGKIGIGFIGKQSVNTYVDGFIEIQRRRSGDMFDIYLKADNSTYYYFSYIRGNMMTQSGNQAYNSLITSAKPNDRKDPASSVRVPYSYMISVEDRLPRFLRRMTSNEEDGGAIPPEPIE